MTTEVIDLLQAQVDDLRAQCEGIEAQTTALKADREVFNVAVHENLAAADALTAQINAIYADNDYMALCKKHGSIANTLMDLKRAEAGE